MKKTTQKIAALIAAFSLTFPAYSFADDAAPEPANAPAAESAQAETAEVKTPGPAVISTGTANTIIKPDKSAPAFEMLERIETIIYGSKREGGLLNRLNDVERTIFGRELPGSLTERQTALIDFLERGTDTQPSVLFKLSVAEWGVSQEIHPTWPLTRRIDAMEAILEGANQPGPLVSRLERLLMKLLPEGIMATQFELPKETIVKGILRDTLTVRNVKVGDIIILALNEQIMVGDMLVAPKGSRVFAHITTVKPPRSFGRSSVIEMEIDGVEVLGPYVVPVNIGGGGQRHDRRGRREPRGRGSSRTRRSCRRLPDPRQRQAAEGRNALLRADLRSDADNRLSDPLADSAAHPAGRARSAGHALGP